MHPELSPDEARCLIDYARQKFAEERYPLSPALRPIRELLAKFNPKPKPEPLPERKPYEPSLAAQRRKRRR